MSKELLENLLIEFDEMGFEPTTLCDSQREVDSFRNRLKQVLDYLKSINNAKPSEALECLEEIIHEFNEPHYELSGEYSYKNELLRRCEDEVNTIKQALLKAQEQEKVLEIIFEKNVNMFGFKRDIKQLGKRLTYKYYQSNLGNYHSGFNIQELTQEEFELVKRYFNE